MISYDLARELKLAGWKQPWTENPEGRWLLSSGATTKAVFRGDFVAYAPSLSELIEACPTTYAYPYGDGSDRSDFALRYYGDNEWQAGYLLYESWEPSAEGQTPEIAVARLWLKLQDVGKSE